MQQIATEEMNYSYPEKARMKPLSVRQVGEGTVYFKVPVGMVVPVARARSFPS